MASMKVFVYYNLHKKLFSVRAMEGSQKGRVIAHLEKLTLWDCAFKVSEAGRQRVLREQRKNVHAGVLGIWGGKDRTIDKSWTKVTYNPYKYKTFVTVKGKKPVYSAVCVHLKHRQIVAQGCNYRNEF